MGDERRDPELVRRAARRAILRRGATAWAAAFALALASAAVTATAIAQLDGALARYREEVALRTALGEVLQLMVDAETAQRGYAITGDPAFLEPYEQTLDELPGTWDDLRRRLVAHGDDADAGELQRAIQARAAFTQDVIELVRAGRTEEARGRIASGEGRRRMDRVRSITRELEARHETSLGALRERVDATRARTFLALGLGAVLTIALAVAALLRVRRDLHAMDAAARAVEQGEQRMRAIADTSVDLVRIHRLDGEVTFASRASEALLGYAPEELVGRQTGALIALEDRQRVLDVVQAFVPRGEAPPAITHRMIHRDGSLRWFETHVAPMLDEDGVARRYHSASRDISARIERDRAMRERQAELAREAQDLRDAAQRDELTGLLNRRGLTELGPGVVAEARRTGAILVAFFCDLDGLKQINDRLGHEEGDRAIVDAAGILRDVARRSDLVARLGGDELVVVGAVRDAREAEAFRGRVEQRAREHDERAGRRYRISISIGVATRSPDAPEHTLDELIAAADAAMYAHKRPRATTNTRGEPIVR